MENPNTQAYWDGRFAAGDWSAHDGNRQTRLFAEAQAPRLGLASGFRGRLLDFGCAEGDAMPVYRAAFPDAHLIGMDFSSAAIEKARAHFGSVAEFVVGTADNVPCVDVIVCSNTLEHLSDDRGVAQRLLGKCGLLVITVPYRERLDLGDEHVNTYDESSFSDLAELATRSFTVFNCPGWSEQGLRRLWWELYAKNVARRLTGRCARARSRQIMFRLQRKAPVSTLSR